MNKNVKKILLFVLVYSIGTALITGYQEPWMREIGLSIKTISIVYSLCALLTVSVIFLCANWVDRKKLKNFVSYAVLLRVITTFLLFILHGTGLNRLIKFIIMLDYVTDIEIQSCIYPLITLITMDNGIYAKKDIYFNGGFYFASLLSSVILGHSIGKLTMTYNFYVLLCSISLFISFIIIHQHKIENVLKEPKNGELIFSNLLKYIKKDRITKVYLFYLIFNQIAYNVVAGIIITIFTTGLNIKTNPALYLNTFACLGSVLLGAFVLKYFTHKDDRIDLFIKYGVRLILYVLAALSANKIIMFIAIIYTLLSSVPYSHVTDGTYVNRINKKYQFAFNNLRSMVNYFGKSIGIFICGHAILLGNRYVFIFASIFCFIQNILIFYASTLKKKEFKWSGILGMKN